MLQLIETTEEMASVIRQGQAYQAKADQVWARIVLAVVNQVLYQKRLELWEEMARRCKRETTYRTMQRAIVALTGGTRLVKAGKVYHQQYAPEQSIVDLVVVKGDTPDTMTIKITAEERYAELRNTFVADWRNVTSLKDMQFPDPTPRIGIAAFISLAEKFRKNEGLWVESERAAIRAALKALECVSGIANGNMPGEDADVTRQACASVSGVNGKPRRAPRS